MLAIASASARDDIANYVSALLEVYILLIFLYILTNMLFQFGLRPSYSRYIDAVLGFLRDVSEPYLRVFRRFLPTTGMFDFSPIIGIILLIVLRSLLPSLIRG
jgi:YggT family protein